MVIVVKTEPVDKNFQLRIIFSWNFRSRSYYNVAQPSCFLHGIIKVQCLAQGHSIARQVIWVLNSGPYSLYRAFSSVFNLRTIRGQEQVQKYLTYTYHVEANIFLYLSLSEEFMLDWDQSLRTSGALGLHFIFPHLSMCWVVFLQSITLNLLLSLLGNSSCPLWGYVFTAHDWIGKSYFLLGRLKEMNSVAQSTSHAHLWLRVFD